MDHNAMSQSASESIAMASGTVKKINLESGMMVIAHGPVETLGWPPMTMSFKASPDLMRDLKEGDVIEFEFTSSGMHSTIISIDKMYTRKAAVIDYSRWFKRLAEVRLSAEILT